MREFKVNPELEKSILGSMPKNYSNLKKAVYIYYQLCLKLQYSLDYYLDNSKVIDYFTDPKNIEKVDGEKNKDVVCYTFNAIFAKLLEKAGVCDSSVYKNLHWEGDKFSPYHYHVYTNIDGLSLVIDGTEGVLNDNDLTLSKYSTHKLSGWGFISVVEGLKYKDQLNNAIDEVQEEVAKLRALEEEYLQIKVEQNSFFRLKLSDRIKMFFDAVKDAPDYSILSFNYILQLKQKLFSKEELGTYSRRKQYIDLIFARNIDSREMEAILFYNPAGYLDDFGFENFNHLQIYLISVKNNSVEKLTLAQFNKLLKSYHLTGRNKDNLTEALPKLAKVGDLHLDKNILADISGDNAFIRTYLIDGHIEFLSSEQAEELKAKQERVDARNDDNQGWHI